ncbi:hypothetical protein MMG00_01845 [Ignatzschineria rhizosphaerae]|uniref:Uncharacterized protein n=1 Tax=Ignatzschineria rhizosphaerae TaxID=2923279 RepID=A0ABY3X7B9_9GAMM|nr:hypothetical protein [Ignatzschineria rhizosphaerae]UNM96631.1 hypothetical protein MMG00_01845 [Ignatzschineria rhizosphaerae]
MTSSNLIFLAVFSIFIFTAFLIVSWAPSILLLIIQKNNLSNKVISLIASIFLSAIIYVSILLNIQKNLINTYILFLILILLPFVIGIFILKFVKKPKQQGKKTIAMILVITASAFVTTAPVSLFFDLIPINSSKELPYILKVTSIALIMGYIPGLILIMKDLAISKQKKLSPCVTEPKRALMTDGIFYFIIIYISTTLFFSFQNNFQNKVLINLGIISETESYYQLLNKNLIEAIYHTGLHNSDIDLFEKDLIFSAYTRFKLGDKHLLCSSSTQDFSDKGCIPFNKGDIQQLCLRVHEENNTDKFHHKKCKRLD